MKLSLTLGLAFCLGECHCYSAIAIASDQAWGDDGNWNWMGEGGWVQVLLLLARGLLVNREAEATTCGAAYATVRGRGTRSDGLGV